MKLVKIAKSILIISVSVLSFNIDSEAIAQNYNYSSNNYYKQGLKYYKSYEYTNAIAEFKKAIKLDPVNNTIRVNIAAAHISRGTYLFNKNIQLNNAANDYRNAIYYLQYDSIIPNSQEAVENLKIAKTNLTMVLETSNIDQSPKNRFKIAKDLRGQGEFREAVVEFNYALADPDVRFGSYLALGDIMRVFKSHGKSIKYYEEALKINQEDGEVHLKLARAFHKLGKMDAAIYEYNVALNSDGENKEIIQALDVIWSSKVESMPNDAIAHMNYGVVLQKKKMFNEALAQYKIAEKIEPNNTKTRLNVGTLFEEMGNYKMAIKAYNTILKINPSETLPHYYKAIALNKLGNINGAINELNMVLKIEPNNKLAKKSYFEIVKNIQDKNKSLELLEAYVKQNPTDFQLNYDLAYELHSNNMNDKALAYYHRVISIKPEYIDAYINAASIYKDKKQFQQAESLIKQGLSINKDNKQLRKLLVSTEESAVINRYKDATGKHNHGDYQGAVDEYLYLISKGEESTEIYTNLGAAYQYLKNYESAKQSFEKAVKLDSKNHNALYYLGAIYHEQKNYNKAIENYNRALIYDPQNMNIKNSLNVATSSLNESILEEGLKLYETQNYKEALVKFNQVLTVNKGDGYAYYYRGMTYDALKKYSSAIKDYKNAVNLSKDLDIAYYALAIDYDLIQNYVKAKEIFSKYITVAKSQESDYVKYAKERIKQL